MSLPDNIREAIKCGPVPNLRPIEEIQADIEEREELRQLLRYEGDDIDLSPVHERLDEINVTTGEEVIFFAYHHLVVPEGMKMGQPLLLEPFQQAFILAVLDNPNKTHFAYLSVAARNGKTMLLAVLLLAYLIGPLAVRNTNIASGAMSREQAGLCFELMHKILIASPDCAGLWEAVASSKKLVGINLNTTYRALSADAKQGYGMSLRVILLDEAARIKGPSSDFTSMLESRQGSFSDFLFLCISTQATSDLDYLSINMDNAERTQDVNTVSHSYAADPDCDLMDETQWYKANPGLGIYRSLEDLQKRMKVATELPVKESEARNQFLNQRVAAQGLAISVSAWKKCGGKIDLDQFRSGEVHRGLDLSAVRDLTSAVLATEDEEGVVHLLPYTCCPTAGIEARSRRDRAPYDQWVRDGHMMAIGGESMDYDQIAATLGEELELHDIKVTSVQYDRAYMKLFRAACEREGVFNGVEWVDVSQTFKEMGIRLSSFQSQLVEGKIRHPNNPCLNMSAAVAVAKQGREGISTLAKDLSTQRIDPMVATVMAAYPFGLGREHRQAFDVSNYIG